MNFTHDRYSAPRTIERMKILGAVLPLELPAKHHCQSSPFISNWPNRQYYLAGRSKTAPSILIFSIALDADYSSYVKSIATFALIFFGYIILVLARVTCKGGRESAFGRHM